MIADPLLLPDDHPIIARSFCLLQEQAQRLGYQVTLEPPADPTAIGYISLRQRRIWVDPVEGSLMTALVLLHELGHALASQRMGMGPGCSATDAELDVFETGEDRAYLYGWAIAMELGLVGSLLSRGTWRAFHGDLFPDLTPIPE